ncbi:MAG: DUF1624 domain-containing protein [Candidatus Thermoplasmatota archaeon]|nr:DUF1624 domain-containing protein [Candidatus Thermoplasmatota archaeon]
MSQQHINRLWEIDTLRGVAIIAMIFFHILYDLSFLRIESLGIYYELSVVFPYVFGSLFIFIVGLSLTLSFEGAKKKLSQPQLYKKFFFRGIKIFSLGLLITVVSWLYYPPGVILFGVLHCIGLSIILCYPFLTRYHLTLPSGLVLLFVGILLRQVMAGFPWLLWLGLRPQHFYTLDYYPLLPWMGVMLIGIYIGNYLYPQGVRRFNLPDWSQKIPVSYMQTLGRHSLIIYLLHQPLIFLILMAYLSFM